MRGAGVTPLPGPETGTHDGDLFAAGKLELVCHPHQVRQGDRLHHAHDVPAVDLHGGFTRAEVGGKLLVEHAGNYQAHDLALARGQGRISFCQLK